MQPFKALSTTTKNLTDSRLFNGSVTGCGGVQAEEDEESWGRGKAPIQLLYLNFTQSTGTGRKPLATHGNIHTTTDNDRLNEEELNTQRNQPKRGANR